MGYHKPAYHSYEQPKHNCSVQDVVETAEVCTPALETVCNPVELTRKNVIDGEYCYVVTHTVCSESIEEIDNEVCTYSYQPKTEATTAMDTTTARKLPRRLATMFLSSLLLSLLWMLSTLNPSKPVSTSQSLYLESPVRICLRTSVSLFQRLRRFLKLLRSV